MTVEAPELGWSLRAEVHLVADFSGKIIVDDPDGIVEEVRWVNRVECDSLCRGNQRWLTEPLAAWLDERWGKGSEGLTITWPVDLPSLSPGFDHFLGAQRVGRSTATTESEAWPERPSFTLRGRRERSEP